MTDKRHVYLFTPSYTGRPDICYLQSMLEAIQSIQNKGWDCKVKFTVGDCLISRTRNMAVSDVLYHPEYTDLVMVDDDVHFEPGAMLRLLQHECDVVMGLYPKRSDPLEFPVKRLEGEEPCTKTGILKIKMGPAGFMRIQRHVLEKMVEAYPERCYYDPLVPGEKAWALFNIELGPCADGESNPYGIKELWGEDFTFCRLWNEIGGEIHADTLLGFEHIGRKPYQGTYAEHLPGFIDALMANNRSTAA